MAWIYGQVTGTQELADILSEAAIGISLQSIDSIDDPGSGYVVGDELTLDGGDFTIAAVVEVLTVGGSGEVTSVRVRNAGIYQDAPTTSVSTTGGSGSGCELTGIFDSNGWLRHRAVNVAGAAQSAVVASAGTGYNVGDLLELVGGIGHTPAIFRVEAVGGSGDVTDVSLADAGSYATPPTNDATTTGGSGSGCELTVTYGVNDSAERQIILEGPGETGTDEIYVGIHTRELTGTRMLELAGFSGFGPNLSWYNQPGISPGDSSVTSSSDSTSGGHYCPTHQLAMTVWVSVLPRRILFVYRAVNFYGSGHLGFLDAYATVGEFPYPLYIAGTTPQPYSGLTSNQDVTGSCINPCAQFWGNGPASIRTASGTWARIRNTHTVSGAGHTNKNTGGITMPYSAPTVTADVPDANDRWANLTQGINSTTTGPFNPMLSTNHQYRIFPTPNSGGDLFLRVPVQVIWCTGELYGTIRGAFAVEGAELLQPENRLREGDRRFTVFGMSHTTADDRMFWCVEEL